MNTLISLLVSTYFFTSPALSQNLSDPANVVSHDSLRVDPIFQFNKTDYEVVNEVEIKRTIVGASLGFGIKPNFDLFGQLGIAFDSEYETGGFTVDGDSGVFFGFGGRGEFYNKEKVKVTGFGLLNIANEEFNGDVSGANVKVETEMTELQVGGVASYEANSQISPYAGLELALLSDGDHKSGNVTRDMDRDNVMNLKFGFVYYLDQSHFRAEAVLLGETTLSFAGGIYL